MNESGKFYSLRIIYSLIGLIIILLAIQSVVINVHLLKEPITEEEVKCYDKNSHEIIGEKCIKIIDPEDNFEITCAVAFFIAFLGGCAIIKQIILIKEEREYQKDNKGRYK